jgi:diguanylate cyclase (GGDEF)-like protein
VAIVAVVCVALAAVASVLLLARRGASSHARERADLLARAEAALAERDTELTRRGFELELARALEQTQTEEEILVVVGAALSRVDPDRPDELHLVDALEPVLHLALATGPNAGAANGAIVTASPWDSLAARTGTILTYDSTERLDVCPHLRSRVTEPCSAVCVPLTAMGRIVGVLYATGPDGIPPSDTAVTSFELIARTTAAHIAIVRAFAKEELTEPDHLTGLPDRRAGLDTIRRRLGQGSRFAVAICDVDHLRAYNARHSSTVGDAALRLLAEVLVRAVRPQDMVARLDGEQFLIVMADISATDAVKAVERVREMLVITQATRPEPAFTVSFGVADSRNATIAEAIIQQAGDALDLAKRSGRNRVSMADAAQPGPDPVT